MDDNEKAKELCVRGYCVSMGEARRIVRSGLFEKVVKRHEIEEKKTATLTKEENML